MKNTKNNFIDSIGNTPLIKLKAASEITGCNIYGKAEYLNPMQLQMKIKNNEKY